MKPKIIGKRWVRYGGSDEALVDVTCCEDAQWKIASLIEITEAARVLNGLLNPPTRGTMVVMKESPLILNFCPICGTEYKK